MLHQNPGYDIESVDPETGRLLFIEVKGKAPRATTVTVSRTQILTALNKPEAFVLAMNDDTAGTPRYIRRTFTKEPDFHMTSANFDLSEFLARSNDLC